MTDHEPLPVVQPRGGGLDVPKRVVQACVPRTTPAGQVEPLPRSWSTRSDDPRALADWLASVGCPHVAMAATGVSWKPIVTLLLSPVTVWVVNAPHITPGPGRKTDGSAAAGIAGLLRHGLVRPTPPRSSGICAR